MYAHIKDIRIYDRNSKYIKQNLKQIILDWNQILEDITFFQNPSDVLEILHSPKTQLSQRIICN